MEQITKRLSREPVRALDHDGAAIVLVPLANHPQPAKLLEDDFDALLAAGISPCWAFNKAGKGSHVRYVRTCPSRAGNMRNVSRLVMEAPGRKCVRYADGDRLNLRRDNLVLSRTGGRAYHFAFQSARAAPTSDIKISGA